MIIITTIFIIIFDKGVINTSKVSSTATWETDCVPCLSTHGTLTSLSPPAGWFAIVTSDGHTAPFFSTIEQVANSKGTFFLTRYDVPAYTNLHDGKHLYPSTSRSGTSLIGLSGISAAVPHQIGQLCTKSFAATSFNGSFFYFF